ncbi:MAG: hypothetical protein ACOC2F_00985 [Bacteroidota bacterium]
MKNHRSNLKKGITLWVMTVLLTFTLKACGKDNVEFPTGTITLTTTKSEVGLIISTPKDSRNITIDWGDGKKSHVNDAINDEEVGGWDWHQYRFFHNYTDTTERTIVVSGTITTFNCRGMQVTDLDLSRIKTLIMLNCRDNKLTTLDVSTNTALNRLECDYNQITSLDVSKNTSLSLLSCVGNQLSASALNDLFRTLPYKRGSDFNEGEVGFIFISHRHPGPADNPGVWDCDRSIAEERGWEFMTLRR